MKVIGMSLASLAILLGLLLRGSAAGASREASGGGVCVVSAQCHVRA
jgi:hypothetical protein